MALLWADGFDGIGQWGSRAHEGAVFDSLTSIITFESATGRRTGSLGMRSNNVTTNGAAVKYFTASSTIILGIAVYRNTTTASTTMTERPYFVFRTGETAQYSLTMGSGTDHSFELRSGGTGGTILGTTSQTPLQSWIYLEIKIVRHGTAGVLEVRFDGVTEITLTEQDTSGTDIDNVYIQCPGTSRKAAWYDDMYICNDQGTTNNDFLGDVRVDAYLPASDGADQDFTLSTGTDTFALLNDVPPDAASYVEGDTLGDRVSTKVDATATDREILGVVTSNICNQSAGSGVLKIKPFALAGVDEVLGPEYQLLDTYLRCPQILEKAPDATDWSYLKLNNTEFGIEITELT
jgi:hypothetical protein